MSGGDTTVEAPKPTAEERELQRSQAEQLRIQTEMLQQQREQQAVLLPMFAEEMGFDVEVDDFGNITNINRIEDPNEALREELETGFLERSLAALRGELPISPALEQELETGEETLRERLRAQLGPGFETSSPGIEALSQFEQKAGIVREEARRGMMTLGEQLSQARGQQNQFLNQSGLDTIRQIGIGDPRQLAGAFGQVAAGFGQAQAPFIQQRQMQMQAGAASARNTAGLFGAGIGAIGSLLGTPAAGAAIFSDRRLKEDAVKVSEDALGPIYMFTIGGVKKLGRMADEVMLKRPGAVLEQYGYKKLDYGSL